MKSFDEHFKGAKNHNQEDLKWLIACYYGTMMNLCNEYSYFGDEDLFGLVLEWFWWDFERFNGITVFPQKFPYLPSVTINRKIKLYRLQNPV